MRLITVFAVGLVLAGCGSSPAPEPSRAERSAMEVARGWEKAWIASDEDQGCELLSASMRLDVSIAAAGCKVALEEMMGEAPELLRRDLAPRPASVRIRDDIAVVELERSRFDTEAPQPLYLVREDGGWRVGHNEPLHRWSKPESCIAGIVASMQQEATWDELGDRDLIAFSQLYCEGAGHEPDKLSRRENQALTDRVLRQLFGGMPGDVS